MSKLLMLGILRTVVFENALTVLLACVLFFAVLGMVLFDWLLPRKRAQYPVGEVFYDI